MARDSSSVLQVLDASPVVPEACCQDDLTMSALLLRFCEQCRPSQFRACLAGCLAETRSCYLGSQCRCQDDLSTSGPSAENKGAVHDVNGGLTQWTLGSLPRSHCLCVSDHNATAPTGCVRCTAVLRAG